jgi:hypothetical protein
VDNALAAPERSCARLARSERAIARGRARAAAAALVVLGLTLASTAHAAPQKKKETSALKIASDAMGNDYLDTSFGRAEKKLRRALSMCQKDACSPKVVAILHRDLATVYVAGMGKLDEGRAEIAAAMDADPTIKVDEDFATPELRKAWDDERRQREGKKPSGEESFAHKAVTEQVIGTPIPVYATLSANVNAVKVRVRYRGVGAKKWRATAMTKQGEGYAAEIPCDAVRKKGQVRYYLQALDGDGEIVAEDGSPRDAFVVKLKSTIKGEPPHVPDAPPPASCDRACGEDEDCEPEAGAAGPVDDARRSWLSLSIQQDLAIAGGASDVCTADNQVNGTVACFRPQGSQYHGTPLLGKNDQVSGGIAAATTRVLLGFDRALTDNLVAGLRLGYVIHGGGPRADGADTNPFLPVHAEIRVGYWFGDKVFTKAGLRPFVHLELGAAQVDSHTTTIVQEDPKRPPPPAQIDNPKSQTLDVYRRAGQGFVGGGVGAMYAFTPGFGMTLDVRLMRLFPTGGTTLSPSLGFAAGF